MSLLDADGIVARIRAVLLGTAGTVRTISSSRFYGDMPDGLDANEAALRATVRPRFEVRVTDLGYSDASPPLLHSVAIKKVGAEIKITRAYTFTEATDDTARDNAMALAAEDVDAICQALGYPGNVGITDNGTIVVSGRLMLDGAPSYDSTPPSGSTPGSIVTVCNFTGTAIVTQATS